MPLPANKEKGAQNDCKNRLRCEEGIASASCCPCSLRCPSPLKKEMEKRFEFGATQEETGETTEVEEVGDWSCGDEIGESFWL